MSREFSFETLQLHAGQTPDKETKSRAVPIYQTTSYVFDDAQEGEDLFALRKPGNIYTRITNPTVAVLEERIAALEGGVGALATASGMAAITYAVLGLAHAGDHVVAATTLYGGTFNLLKETLPRYGVTTTFVDVDNPEEIEAAIKDNTKLVLIESLGNPLINIPDFEKIAGWLTENNFQWGINTNFNKLVKVKPNYLKVSLDAYSNESYEQLRGVAAYETVRENIKAYAAWKKENSPGTSLGIQQLVKEPEDVKRFYDANKDLDVDYMVFRPVESTAGSYYRDERKKRDAEEIKKIVSDMAMDDERVTLNFKWGLLDRQEERCTASWAQMALNEKGEVMYCCHKPYQIIGHIMDEDILAKKMAAVTDMSMCDIPCRMTAPNLEVKKMEQARKDACFI